MPMNSVRSIFVYEEYFKSYLSALHEILAAQGDRNRAPLDLERPFHSLCERISAPYSMIWLRMRAWSTGIYKACHSQTIEDSGGAPIPVKMRTWHGTVRESHRNCPHLATINCEFARLGTRA